MKQNNRQIENAYNMMKYLYSELNGKRFKSFEVGNIDKLDDLYAMVISRWCMSLAKEGLYKEYVHIEDVELTSPKGQINIPKSIAKQTRSRGTLICSYDELSDNIYINHVLKGTLQYLLYDTNISKNIKTEITKAMQPFSGVEYTDINTVKWKSIKFNNSNIRYKHLIELCKTYVFEKKAVNNGWLNDDERVYILFKKQIIKWYDSKYNETDTVELVEEQFTMKEFEPQFELSINKLQKLVAIRNDYIAMLVCIRLQDENILKNPTLPRKQAEELVKYCRNYSADYRVKTVGCIVYVNIDKRKLNFQPITVNIYNDIMIGETTVDLHDQWKFVENKIVDTYKYFIEREKVKHKPNLKQT